MIDIPKAMIEHDSFAASAFVLLYTNNSHELYQVTERSTFKGTCIALIKANGPVGNITIKAGPPV
jgi:hypothetical protein